MDRPVAYSVKGSASEPAVVSSARRPGERPKAAGAGCAHICPELALRGELVLVLGLVSGGACGPAGQLGLVLRPVRDERVLQRRQCRLARGRLWNRRRRDLVQLAAARGGRRGEERFQCCLLVRVLGQLGAGLGVTRGVGGFEEIGRAYV